MAGTRLVTIITVIINNSSNTVMVTLRPWDSWARKGLCSYRPLIPMPSEWTKAPWEWQLQKQPYIFALKRPRGNTGFLRAEGEAEWAKAAQFVRLSFLTRPWLSCNASCVHCMAPFDVDLCMLNLSTCYVVMGGATCDLGYCDARTPVPEGYRLAPDGSWSCADTHYGNPSAICVVNDDCVAEWRPIGCDRLHPCVAPTDDLCRRTVPPGGQCLIRCREPFVGGASLARCEENNVDITKILDWSPPRPSCALFICPEPEIVPPGYIRTADNWRCAPGYVGAPKAFCDMDAYCTVTTILSGCSRDAACWPLVVDECDASACMGVDPGDTCLVRCKAPYTGTPGVAACPADNIDPFAPVTWETEPNCSLTSCSEPQSIPATATGGGARGRGGLPARLRLFPRTSTAGRVWHAFSLCGTCRVLLPREHVRLRDGATGPVLPGPLPLSIPGAACRGNEVPCAALPQQAACGFDVSDCQSVPPGGSCEEQLS
eukprot:s3421_g1.t1